MAARRPRQSNQGLVIALVFAVLIIIGLGVATYMQSNAKAAADKDAADAKSKEKKMTEDRNWYKFQAQLYRAYMGQTEGLDLTELGTARGSFDTGSLGSGSSDKEPVTKLIKEKLDVDLLWDPTQNRPKNNYVALLKQAQDRADAAEKSSTEYMAARDVAQKAAKKSDDLLKAERAAFDAKLVELTKRTETDMSKYLDTIGELRNEITRLGEVNDTIRKSSTDEKKKVDDQLAKATQKVKELFDQVDAKKQAIAELKNNGTELAPKSFENDWKIVEISHSRSTAHSASFLGAVPPDSRVEGTQTAATVYINLGSADHVHPQLTFSIHSPGPDGRPLPETKGSLEVVRALADHLSEARVLTVKDRNKNPVVVGDILYNPNWSPTAKKHVALAGMMDLLGNGRDSTMELIRNLEKQNVIVDAYVDPRENVVKGKGITIQTDYIIVPDANVELMVGESERQRETSKKREDEIAKMLRQAKENGVQNIKLPKYLEQIGYRMPRNSIEMNTYERGPAPAAGSPEAAEGATQKMEDKAPADNKPTEDKPK
jgi:Asp-tRNA(Asn)/Glu-tRNA(Gln) amidotransferase C subunit